MARSGSPSLAESGAESAPKLSAGDIVELEPEENMFTPVMICGKNDEGLVGVHIYNFEQPGKEVFSLVYPIRPETIGDKLGHWDESKIETVLARSKADQ